MDNQSRIDPFDGLDQASRLRLLDGLAGDGPDLAQLLIELAEVARVQGKTRLAANLYNSALYQEEARGRPGSEIAVVCTQAIAEIELKIGDPTSARLWARRLASVAPDDKTAKSAERLAKKASELVARRASERRPGASASVDPRKRPTRLPSEVVPSKGPSTDAPTMVEGLLQSIDAGGPELGAVLLEAAQRALEKQAFGAALRYAGMTKTYENGRGDPQSPVAVEALIIGATIALDRGNLSAARMSIDELMSHPSAAVNAKGTKLQRRLRRLEKPTQTEVRPPAAIGPGDLREVYVPRPEEWTLTFADVGGMADAKDAIRRYGILPAQDPRLAERFGIESGGALLLNGPPGCGKTLLARAAAGEMGVPLFAVRIADLVNPLYGMSERSIQAVFDAARKAAPCVLFLDEVDAFTEDRSKPLLPQAYIESANVFLANLDNGLNQGVLIIGAANRLEAMDPAFLRPGRFSRKIFVGPPDAVARRAIWEISLHKRPVAADVDIDVLTELSDGLTGADITHAAGDAAENVWVQCANDGVEREVGQIDLLAALRPHLEGQRRRRVDELIARRWGEEIEEGA